MTSSVAGTFPCWSWAPAGRRTSGVRSSHRRAVIPDMSYAISGSKKSRSMAETLQAQSPESNGAAEAYDPSGRVYMLVLLFAAAVLNATVALHVNLDKMSEPERETFTA